MKKIKILLMVLLVGVILVGCSSSKLSDAYNEDELKKDAQGIVSMICNEEYDKVIDQMSDNIKGKISAEQLKEVWQPIKEKVGSFKSIEKEGVIGKDGLAIVVEVAEFENGKAQFTITYNEDMKLEGLYIK
ncbi:DUF3887 domain-containing protein [Paraclostridium bifermentans]|uniref:DUF3887 domain-containing protein n=1 Tax=Paraclostridium bifermentans TaxID=1490 RepID=UPI00359C93B2